MSKIHQQGIIKAASEYSKKILTEDIPRELIFHNADHTLDVVHAVIEICDELDVSEDDREILLLSAWFHDTGYSKTYLGHERESMRIAEEFLKEAKYPNDKIEIIKSCIESTDYLVEPRNHLEEILSDADLYHLSTDKCFIKSEQLRNEIEHFKIKEFKNEREWKKMNLLFLEKHHYYTKYGKEVLEEGRLKNVELLKNRLQKDQKKKKKLKKLELENSKLNEKIGKTKEKDNKPNRGIETMFRTTSKNHLELSAIADNKANIMISINAIIISILMSVLIRKFEDYPNLIIPTVILVLVSLSTIVFAVLATRPNITKGKFKREDILNQRTNLLFFGNFYKMELEEYEWGINQLMTRSDLLYGSMTKDIYFLGKVLGRKYRLLRIAYTIFMFGLVISVLSYGIALMFFPVYH